jgi:type IV pilus assembly protein PilP
MSCAVDANMTRARTTARLLSLCLVALLSACTDNEGMIALQDYVSSVVNRPPGVIEPPPEFVTYEAFTYSAASLRGPFDLPVDASAALRNQQNNLVRPDENRVREPLENFAIGNLAMVGTLGRGGETWALIRDENGSVTRVGVGNYLGRNHGRISAVTQNQVDIVEIVPTGDGGWIERPQSIPLTQ